MKIAIIGAGSIGLLFGGYLGINHQITMVTRRTEQANFLNNEGIRVVTESGSFITPVKSGDYKEQLLNKQDLIILAVKQYDLSSVMTSLNKIDQKIPLLFLQNGMGHISMLKKLKNEHIFLGTVEHGAFKTNETTVMHNGGGKTNLAVYKGSNIVLESIVSDKQPQFLFHSHQNWEVMLVQKLFINAMINPLTAILKVKNGELIHNPHYFQILKAFFEEIFPVFSFMDKEVVFSEIVKVCKSTSENKSSMLSDILHNRKTEIDGILGYIIQRSEEENIHLPITLTLLQMVKGMERGRGE